MNVRSLGDRPGAVPAAAGALVLGLLGAVVSVRGTAPGDVLVRDAVTSHQVPALYDAFSGLTTALSPPAVLGALAVVTTGLAARRRSAGPLVALVTVLSGLALLVAAVKALVGRYGPDGGMPLPHDGYYPSGHTSSCLVAIGTVVMLLTQPGSAARRRGLVGAGGVATVVAVALVYDDYHWTSDVVGGAAAGVCVLGLHLLTAALVSQPSGEEAGHRAPD